MKGKKITTLMLACAMALLLIACGSKPAADTDGGAASNEPKQTETNQAKADTDSAEKNIKITQTAARAVQTEKYECADFSMTIPKGWTVTAGGTNIYHSIRVYDPTEPRNQMFVLLKADILLHSQAGKDAYQQLYNLGSTQMALFAKAAVLENPSTEGFFKIFPQYTAYVSAVEPDYAGYVFPQFNNFAVTDRYPLHQPPEGLRPER